MMARIIGCIRTEQPPKPRVPYAEVKDLRYAAAEAGVINGMTCVGSWGPSQNGSVSASTLAIMENHRTMVAVRSL